MGRAGAHLEPGVQPACQLAGWRVDWVRALQGLGACPSGFGMQLELRVQLRRCMHAARGGVGEGVCALP